jgi:hypothetical protein
MDDYTKKCIRDFLANQSSLESADTSISIRQKRRRWERRDYENETVRKKSSKWGLG